MDPWGGEDDDMGAPNRRGRVATVGLKGFVKEKTSGIYPHGLAHLSVYHQKIDLCPVLHLQTNRFL